eukprot:CAMPEP_0113620906 /NCGR_PEP_ID=MMETSP0017_2-20120614/10664_1 /TAXON_ID=2856 /ORGANISM="Cylindrotheca closterium" /LENGTH=1444 /DNA_ID=CAMNT_0000530601 /DNA_START=213 /DNA_END=4547 /DNA_ORIENTATION=+ /assembly_acc=CAM_ASM_000147
MENAAPRRTIEQLVAAGSSSRSIRGSKKLKVINKITGSSKHVRLLPAFSSTSSAYDWLHEHEGIKMAKLLEFPAAQQEALDQKTQEIQITTSASNGSNESVCSAKELREQTIEQILSRYPSSDETILSIQVVDVKEEEPTQAPSPKAVPPRPKPVTRNSNTVGGSMRLKVTNGHTDKSKNVRIMKATASSASTYDWLYNHEGLKIGHVVEFPEEQQKGLDQNTHQLQITVSALGAESVVSGEQLRSQTLWQIVEGLPDYNSAVISMFIEVVEAKDEEPAPAKEPVAAAKDEEPTPAPEPAVMPPPTLRAMKSNTVGGSMRLKVTNSHTDKSKNVRIMKATASSASTYDWLYNHEGLQIGQVLEFPEEQQTGLDQKTHELQITISAKGTETVVPGKEVHSKTLMQVVEGLPDYNSALIAMSIQVVEAKDEESAPSPKTEVMPPPPTMRAMKSNTIGGSMRLKVTNSHTDKSKNVRIMTATASSASTYDWLYNHEGLQIGQVLEFPEEQQTGLDQKTHELQITVSTEGTESVVSGKEVHSKTLMQIVEGLPDYNKTLIAISIEVVEVKEEEAETTADISSVPVGTTAASRNSSANHGGSLHLRVSNSHTGVSKNVRVMPSTFSATTSGYDWLYQHDGLKIAKVLDFPEHQEAMDQKTQEIQVAMNADGIDEKVYSAEDLCFQTMPKILDPIFEQLPDPDTLITMSIQVVDVKANEEEEEDGNKQEKEEELSEEAKEAARLKKKEEEAAFWAAEEAKMLAQAEERKKQKEAKLQAALQAEKAALEAAQKQAAEKEAAIKAEEEERLAKREAQKQAALQAEEEARKKAEEERKEQEEEEDRAQQRGVQELQSKRQRTSIITAQLSGASPSAFAGASFAPFDDDDDDEEGYNDALSDDDELLMDDENRALESMDSQSLDDELLTDDEDQELEAMDMAVSLAAMTGGNQSEQPVEEDGNHDDEIEDLLAAEEEQELENQIKAEELERSHREAEAILAAEEMEELMRMEEAKRLEELQEEGEGDDAGGTRGIMDEVPIPRDVLPAADVGQDNNDEAEESAEDAARRENVDQLERLLETKETDSKRENERMLALERKAAEMEHANMFAPVEESPRDRSVKIDEPKRRKGGVEGRLRKVEQGFVADPARKRSADVIPLSVQFNGFLRKLRKAVNQVKVYQAARQEAEATRTEMVNDFGSLSETTPLYDLVGKKANLDQIDEINARKAAEACKAQGIRSYKSIDQLVELQGKASADEYQEEMVKYVDAWDEAVSTRVNKAMMLHKKLEQDVLHYENKVAKLRTQAHDLEAKGKFLSTKQAARLNRNEMKLNDAWQIHELECSAICNLLEEITIEGWHDLFPLVRSSVEWEIRRMEREISTYGLGLPGLLKTLGKTVNDVPIPETKHHLRKEIAEQQNLNRELERKINQLQTALKGSWTTKTEFQKVMQAENIEL